MDGLFGLIWVVFIVVTLTNAITGKNKKKQNKQTSVPPFTAQPTVRPAEPVKPAQQPRPVALGEVEKRFTAPQTEQPRTPVAPPAPATAVAAPKVHPHLTLDCDIDEPSGSMDFVSTEGADPCHDDDLPDRRAPRPVLAAAQEQPGLALEWTGDALVRSVIMQEVLTRPCQRQRR